MRGEFKSPTYSIEAFEQLSKRLEDEDPFKADEITDQNEIVMDIFKDSQKALKKFELGRSMEELEQFIDEILSPGVEESREIIDTSVSPNITPVQQTEAKLPVDVNMATSANTVLPILAQNNSTNLATLYGIDYNRMNTAQKIEAFYKPFRTA